MKTLSKLENKRLRIRVKRHDDELGWVNDIPRPTHSDSERPDPVKTPKAETWLPRFSAFETSDCQSDTVAIIPPVPKPRKMRPTINCSRVKAVSRLDDGANPADYAGNENGFAAS